MQKPDSPRHRSQSPFPVPGSAGLGGERGSRPARPRKGAVAALPVPMLRPLPGLRRCPGPPPARLQAQPGLARGAGEEQAGPKLFAPKQRSERYASVT